MYGHALQCLFLMVAVFAVSLDLFEVCVFVCVFCFQFRHTMFEKGRVWKHYISLRYFKRQTSKNKLVLVRLYIHVRSCCIAFPLSTLY